MLLILILRHAEKEANAFCCIMEINDLTAIPHIYVINGLTILKMQL